MLIDLVLGGYEEWRPSRAPRVICVEGKGAGKSPSGGDLGGDRAL